MTNPEQPAGPAHPARAAGYALLGLAALALVIGVISLFAGGSGDDPSAAPSTAQSTGSEAAAPSTTGGDSSTTPAPSSPSSSAGGTPTTTAPAATGDPSAANPGAPTTDAPAPPVVTVPKSPVRVYNNSTTIGLAARASDEVKRAGWEVAETGNYSQGTIPTTTVYYRPGTDEEASARDLARVLHAEVKPRFDGIESAKPGIIVIVTNDYRGPSGKIS